jgi:hypothetical protein
LGNSLDLDAGGAHPRNGKLRKSKDKLRYQQQKRRQGVSLPFCFFMELH